MKTGIMAGRNFAGVAVFSAGTVMNWHISCPSQNNIKVLIKLIGDAKAHKVGIQELSLI
jgi:hypothetical protein